MVSQELKAGGAITGCRLLTQAMARLLVISCMRSLINVVLVLWNALPPVIPVQLVQ